MEIRLNTIFGDLYNNIKNGLFIKMLQNTTPPHIAHIIFDIFGLEATKMYTFKIKDIYNVFLITCNTKEVQSKEIMIDNEIGLLVFYPDILTSTETRLSKIINIVNTIIEKIIYFLKKNNIIIKNEKLSLRISNIFTMYMVLYFYAAENKNFPWYEKHKEYYDELMKYSIEELFDNMKILSL